MITPPLLGPFFPPFTTPSLRLLSPFFFAPTSLPSVQRLFTWRPVPIYAEIERSKRVNVSRRACCTAQISEPP